MGWAGLEGVWRFLITLCMYEFARCWVYSCFRVTGLHWDGCTFLHLVATRTPQYGGIVFGFGQLSIWMSVRLLTLIELPLPRHQRTRRHQRPAYVQVPT